jgi:hypothetical protein
VDFWDGKIAGEEGVLRIRCSARQKYHWWNFTRAWVVEGHQPAIASDSLGVAWSGRFFFVELRFACKLLRFHCDELRCFAFKKLILKEQRLPLNQRVQDSGPCAPTNQFNLLGAASNLPR